MSPEYRVVVPRGSGEAFKKAVSRIKGVEVFDTQERKRDKLVKKYIRKYRELIGIVRTPKEAELRRKINNNYQVLIEDALKYIKRNAYRSDIITPSPQLNVSEMRGVVDELFEETFQAYPNLVNTKNGRVSWQAKQYYMVAPDEAQALIYRYGLHDGVIREYTEVGTLMGYRADGKPRDLISHTFRRIWKKLVDQDLIKIQSAF